MESNDKDIKIIIRNTTVSKSLGKPDAMGEAVEIVHIPTGIRAESFSLSTTFGNQARCMQNLEILLKTIAVKPIIMNEDPETLCCPKCGAIILPSYNYCPGCAQAIAK